MAIINYGKESQVYSTYLVVQLYTLHTIFFFLQQRTASIQFLTNVSIVFKVCDLTQFGSYITY